MGGLFHYFYSTIGKTASATSHHRNMDSLHGQLGQLLNDAQALLADIAPGASGSQFGMSFISG
jgi:hypothetical protein